MLDSTRSRLRSATTIAAIALTAGFLAACAAPQTKSMVAPKKRLKEYFAESEYGVKASPRVTTQTTKLARGGGRDQIGKPYKVRGRVYYPKEDKNYKKTGLASWYGDAFHGRLTANGEIYDMTHLTAAHPTMPLPSYARVTNKANGSSVVVRVNDRGPYANDRVIDLSKRAAEMLDYTHAGTAMVQVEYIGRARLDGEDDAYLMASYQPGKGAPDPSEGLPGGVMIAMNGPTPSQGLVASSAFADTIAGDGGETLGSIALPTYGPIAPQRPGPGEIDSRFALASLSYAENTRPGSASAFAALEASRLTPDEVVQSWKRMNAEPAVRRSAEPYIAAGSFTAREDAERMARTLAPFGQTEIETSTIGGTDWYGVILRPVGREALDDLLKAAWDHGATDAMTIRE